MMKRFCGAMAGLLVAVALCGAQVVITSKPGSGGGGSSTVPSEFPDPVVFNGTNTHNAGEYFNSPTIFSATMTNFTSRTGGRLIEVGKAFNETNIIYGSFYSTNVSGSGLDGVGYKMSFVAIVDSNGVKRFDIYNPPLTNLPNFSIINTNYTLYFGGIGVTIAGTENTAVGFGAFDSNVSGERNTALGRLAMNANISGSRNTAVGRCAMTIGTNCYQTVAVGGQALGATLSATCSVAVGYDALNQLIDGWYDVGVGIDAGYQMLHGNNNTVLGSIALWNMTNANNIVAVGHAAGWFLYPDQNVTVTGSNSIYIGAYSQGGSNDNNSIVIGTSATGNGANTTVIGTPNTTNAVVYGLRAWRVVSDYALTSGSIANDSFSVPTNSVTDMRLTVIPYGTTGNTLSYQLNGDTAENYFVEDDFISGGSLAVNANGTMSYGIMGRHGTVGGLAIAEFPSALITRIGGLHMVANSFERNSSRRGMTGGTWSGTNAVTSVLIFPATGNFTNGYRRILEVR